MKKSTIIGLLTFTFLLFGSLSVYASWGMSYGSDIHSATVTVYGYSYTGTTVVADEVYADSFLYKSGLLVDSDSDLVYNNTWAQADVSTFNSIGEETYRIEGYHYAKVNNDIVNEYTSASKRL
ncbi:hypothetical protein [Desulfitobacterium hafniense]|uniref:hypothetical protein n=1 Tax=Desulfitobacterium hafniense TaxID=49338 RepID=UPI000366CFB4|nr:hypothetical protein [Desulfitobacterium hafniense]